MCHKKYRKVSVLLLFLLIIKSCICLGQGPGAALQFSTTLTPTSCANEKGSILVNATGGTPPYTYSFADWPFQSSRLWLCKAGTYPVVVKDAAGATDSTTVIVKNNYQNVGLTVAGFNASGCATADGRVVLTASGGTPPYSYSMDMVNFQPANTFTNLSPGAYYFIAKDANGCTATMWYAIKSNNCQVLNGYSGTASNYVCGNDGTIDISLVNATAPIAYSLDGINYQSSSLFTGLAGGSYTLHMTDGNGTKYLYTVNMFARCELVPDGTVTDATCGYTDGSISAVATKGVPPYQYSIDGANFQSNPLFSGLAPGNYTIIVKDAAGTSKMRTFPVKENCVTITATATPATCSNNGSITVTGAGGANPVQYTIDGTNYQGNNIFTGLAPGKYTATVMDASGKTASTSISVEDNCNNVVATVINSKCNYIIGKITVSATFGTPPYTYSISFGSWQSSNEFSGLNPGTYPVWAKDATGTIKTTSAIIVGSPIPWTSVDITPAGCDLTGGTVKITPLGGTPPYQFSINGIDWQPSTVFNINPNDPQFLAYVKDSFGCWSGNGYFAVPIHCIRLQLVGKDASCGNNNGSITVYGSGGWSPYEYSLDGVNWQTNSVFTGLGPGTYTIYGKEAGGTTGSKTITINNVCLSVSLSATDAACGKSSGSITVSASNGTAPYTYSINGVNFQNSNTFTAVAGGSYVITVKDAAGHTTTANISVVDLPGPQIMANATAASCANNDGSITSVGSAGASPYTYAIDNGAFQQTGSFNALATGNYTAVVKDANGCTASQPVIVTLTNNLSVDAGPNLTICEGTGGTLQATSNGTSFTWLPAADITNTTLLSPRASPRVTTKYYLTAYSGACEKKDSVMVIVDPAPMADAGADITICYGQSAQLNGNGGVQYAWSPATYLNNPSIAGPTVTRPPGTISYNLVITDAKGCQSISAETVTVMVTPPAKIFAGNDTSVYINQPLPLNAVDVNNSGFTKYSWSPSQGLNDPFIPNPVVVTSKNMTYTLVASTPNGCEGTDSIKITAFAVADIFVPNSFTPDGNGRNDILKAIPIGIREFRFFAVYNRWGQRIFYTTTPGIGWNGAVNGVTQQTGAYVWATAGVTFKGDLIERKGTVVLVK